MVVVVWAIGFWWVIEVYGWWFCDDCGTDGVFLVGAWTCVVDCCGLLVGGGGKWLFLLLPRIERDRKDE